ncbi:MAG: UbiA family prenyltransferase [Bernardetiaceae bacterium]
MFSKATWQHLRIPFSVFLMPVFCLGVAVAGWDHVTGWAYGLLWAILHLFLYPASNGFNSYYDRDEESIGGLEKPPPVAQDLLWAALLFDAVALLLGLVFGWSFVGMLLIYGLASKAYSHPWIRFKKYPFLGLVVVSFFQGGFTLAMCVMALRGWELPQLWDNRELWLLPAALSSLLLLGSYPMTQVYQHREDARRGDRTLSRLLGIRGTFAFTAGVFLLANLGFYTYLSLPFFGMFQVFLLPVLLYFGYWFWQVWQDESAADFRHTMRLNQLSSVSMIGFFTLLSYLQSLA